MKRAACIPMVALLADISLTSCYGWQGRQSIHHSIETRRMFDGQRRKYLGLVASSFVGAILPDGQKSAASNLPEPTGADLSKVGTVGTLVPIISIRSSLEKLKSQLAEPPNSSLIIDASIPRDETAFKRIFDAYSDPVSYKQKFLDQNAFLVYYTKGFDGPGRSNIEEPTNQRQTQQFGLRNEAWISWESFLAETAFAKDKDNDCVAYLNATIQAIDSYIMLAPANDVEIAKSQVGMP